MLHDEEDNLTLWSSMYRPAISVTLDNTFENKDLSPLPTPDDETGCPTHTDRTSAVRQTFLDDITPSDLSRLEDNIQVQYSTAFKRRDSHELDLSPRRSARESLVDHMLLSLDQFHPSTTAVNTNNFNFKPRNLSSIGRYYSENDRPLHVGFGDDELPQPRTKYSNQSRQGLGHDSSYSTDVEDIHEVNYHGADKYSRSRSKSSCSKFKTALTDLVIGPRVDLLPGYRDQLPSSPLGISKKSYSHACNGSSRSNNKGSSFDLGYYQPTNNQRWVRSGRMGRSSSFDYGSEYYCGNQNPRNWNNIYEPYYHDQEIAASLSSTKILTTTTTTTTTTSPAITPANHRRLQLTTSATMPHLDPLAISMYSSKADLTNGVRMTRNVIKGNLDSWENKITKSVANTPNVNNATSRNLNPRPDTKDQSHQLMPQTPGTNMKGRTTHYHRHGRGEKDSPSSSTGTIPTSTIGISASQIKERPGFFRRVFGSSKNNVGNGSNATSSSRYQSLEQSPPHGSPSSVETADRSNFRTPPIDSQLNSGSARESFPSTPSSPILATATSSPAPIPPPPPPPPQFQLSQESMQQLNKKPSSLFRRRKKSANSGAGALLPLQQPQQQQQKQPRTPRTEVSFDKMLPNPPTNISCTSHSYLQTPASPIEQNPHREYDRKCNESLSDVEREALRSFSSSYNPAPSATIRTVNQLDHEPSKTLNSPLMSNQKFATVHRRSRSQTTGFEEMRLSRDPTLFQEFTSSNNRQRLPLIKSTHPNSTPLNKTDKKGSNFSGRNHQSQSESSFEGVVVTGDNQSFTWSRSPPLVTRQRMNEPASSIRKTHIARQQSGDWVMITQTKSSGNIEKDDRLWLEPSSSSDEESTPSQLETTESMLFSIDKLRTDFKDSLHESITSLPEPLNDEKKLKTLRTSDIENTLVVPGTPLIKSPVLSDQDSTDSFQVFESARQIFDGIEDLISKDRAASWLGEEDAFRVRVLEAYLRLFNFTNLNILAALRMLCSRLILKAESQQVDRILVAFSKRWSECNPCHGFKVTDIVHTICYSLLLLNTDLHLADIDQKMTRSQFVKNVMQTIRKIVTDSAPDAFELSKSTNLSGKGTSSDHETLKPEASKTERLSLEVDKPSSWRSSIKSPQLRSDGDMSHPTPLDFETPGDDSGPLVRTPFHGTMRTWEVQIEIILKSFYNSIRNERLPLNSFPSEQTNILSSSTNNLTPYSHGLVCRTPSVLSHTPSENQSCRTRAIETLRIGTGKRPIKNRSRPRLYPTSGFGSSRTSLDDQSSMWSPVSSSTWSKYSLGKTQTSVSVDSSKSAWPNQDYQQSIGFANALSQAIIREEMVGSSSSTHDPDDFPRVASLLEDESLELHGAPWAKEGIVKHKHHLESVDKKARERTWTEVFAVIEKGYLSLFSFSTKSLRLKSKGKPTQGIVGGGNWQENAQNLGSFLLQQTIASALPSPGYSKSRPHVWALSLPTGAVHLFQVGTPDIVKEFVSTANYWGARLSNHPLVGGISNIEYGWSDSVINSCLSENETISCIMENCKRPTTSSRHRPSISGRSSAPSSTRVSLDQGFSGMPRTRVTADKINISDWTPPTQSMRASHLTEHEQLCALTNYVSGIEEELQKHNKLRTPMLLAFTPRHPNAQKAMANWEKKSAYLLREIVKFRTYIDCLQAAEASRIRIQNERQNQNTDLPEAVETEKVNAEKETTPNE